MEHIFIFTYGTLMEGRRNYKKYLEERVFSTKKAYVLGELYHLENKDYPGFVCSDMDSNVQKMNGLKTCNEVGGVGAKNLNKVYGEIHELANDEKLLAELADLETCDNADDYLNEYIREEIEVFTLDDKFFARLPVYVYNTKGKPNENDIRVKVESGDWNEYKNSIKAHYYLDL